MELERRFINGVVSAEPHKEAQAENLMRVGGYAALFGKYANIGDWFAEVINDDFFNGASFEECACLFNHDQNHVLGRVRNGTLTLEVDDKGLLYRADLPPSRADVYELIKNGYVYSSSFAFIIDAEEWKVVPAEQLADALPPKDIAALSDEKGRVYVRYLKRARAVYDVSPVTFPAYSQTSTTALRGLDEIKKGNNLSSLYEMKKRFLTALNTI